MIDSVIFDYAGVLTVGDPGYIWYSKNVSDFIDRKPHYDELGHQVDVGILTKNQFVERVSESTGIPQESVWAGIKSSTTINWQMIEYIIQLKKRYKIAIVSNYVHEWLDEILEENNLKQYFDTVVISSLEKAVKPDRELFEIAISRLGTTFEHTLFIDDRQDNVTGAKKIGMSGLLYTSFNQISQELDALLT